MVIKVAKNTCGQKQNGVYVELKLVEKKPEMQLQLTPHQSKTPRHLWHYPENVLNTLRENY